MEDSNLENDLHDANPLIAIKASNNNSRNVLEESKSKIYFISN